MEETTTTTGPTIEEIRKAVRQARVEGKDLILEGYESSTGGIANYRVSLRNGVYPDLMRKSLEALPSVKRPDDVDSLVWDDVVSKKRDTWKLKLSDESKSEGSGREFSKKLIYHSDGYATYDDDQDVTIITNLERIEVEYTHKPDAKVSSRPARARKPSAVASEKLDSMLPIDRFIGQLNLRPAKLRGIRVA